MTYYQDRAPNEYDLCRAYDELAEAELTRAIIDIAEERCRERGLDPNDPGLRIGDFISEAEVRELRGR